MFSNILQEEIISNTLQFSTLEQFRKRCLQKLESNKREENKCPKRCERRFAV